MKAHQTRVVACTALLSLRFAAIGLSDSFDLLFSSVSSFYF